MRKRWMAVLCAVCLCFGMAACGANEIEQEDEIRVQPVDENYQEVSNGTGEETEKETENTDDATTGGADDAAKHDMTGASDALSPELLTERKIGQVTEIGTNTLTLTMNVNGGKGQMGGKRQTNMEGAAGFESLKGGADGENQMPPDIGGMMPPDNEGMTPPEESKEAEFGALPDNEGMTPPEESKEAEFGALPDNGGVMPPEGSGEAEFGALPDNGGATPPEESKETEFGALPDIGGNGFGERSDRIGGQGETATLPVAEEALDELAALAVGDFVVVETDETGTITAISVWTEEMGKMPQMGGANGFVEIGNGGGTPSFPSIEGIGADGSGIHDSSTAAQ